MKAPLFILPTTGNTGYRGKYPTRCRMVSGGNVCGLHVELNNGVRLWTAKGPDHFGNIPRLTTDCAEALANAVPMTDSQYEELKAAKDVLAARAGIAGHGRRAELEARVRRMVSAIGADVEPAPVEIRRDNVEYHAGRAAFDAGIQFSDCPYPPAGVRAERWQLGHEEAARQSVDASYMADVQRAADILRVSEALDWAYRQGYYVGERAAESFARLCGLEVKKESLGMYGDKLAFVPSNRESN